MSKPSSVIPSEIEFMKLAWYYWMSRGSVSYLSMDKQDYLNFLDGEWDKDDTGNQVVCCECYTPLEFHPIHVSHILSKGTMPAYRLDIRNVKPLCEFHHNQWEFKSRKPMSIFAQCDDIMKQLKREYYKSRSIPGREF